METDKNIETEWKNIRGCIEKAAKQAKCNKKKIRSRRGFRLWNDEVAKGIKENKGAYMYLQLNTDETGCIY